MFSPPISIYTVGVPLFGKRDALIGDLQGTFLHRRQPFSFHPDLTSFSLPLENPRCSLCPSRRGMGNRRQEYDSFFFLPARERPSLPFSRGVFFPCGLSSRPRKILLTHSLDGLFYFLPLSSVTLSPFFNVLCSSPSGRSSSLPSEVITVGRPLLFRHSFFYQFSLNHRRSWPLTQSIKLKGGPDLFPSVTLSPSFHPLSVPPAGVLKRISSSAGLIFTQTGFF